MSSYKIFFSNIGYARGINGCLRHHFIYMHRHIYCSANVQEKVLGQVKEVIKKEDPDLCCFVEIEKSFNHIEKLMSNKYQFFDAETKYGQKSWLNFFPLTRGKSNGFMAKDDLSYNKIYFKKGRKRLIYQIKLNENTTLFFAHFSLNKKTRKQQLLQVRSLFEQSKGKVIFLGDFNILSGFNELKPLLRDDLVLLNDKNLPTFTFYRKSLVLDLCVCTRNIAPDVKLKIIPQPYSDHAGLVVEVRGV